MKAVWALGLALMMGGCAAKARCQPQIVTVQWVDGSVSSWTVTACGARRTE